jgi:hypothetical protein
LRQSKTVRSQANLGLMILAILNPPFSWVEPVEKHRCAGKLELNQTLLKAPAAPAKSSGDGCGVIQTEKNW